MINEIYNTDCLEGLRLLPNDFIDLTVTSPPYDNLRKYNGYSWDFNNIAKELYRVTKQGGVIVWVVNDATINGSETGTSFKQALYFKEIGFNLHDTMIYLKSNPIPQVKTKRYTNSFEYMFIFSKGTPKTCNYIMEECKSKGRNPGRNAFKSSGEGKRKTKNVIVNDKKIKSNVWMYSSPKFKGHTAVFSENLARDHIISWSNEGDIILDPFMGSGTVAKMAILNNRKYLGFEISKEYCNIAEERIKKEQLKKVKE